MKKSYIKIKINELLRNYLIFIYKQSIMNETLLLIIIFLVFIIIMTLILNKIEKDRIKLIGDFFQKVLPSIPFTKIIQLFKESKK